MCCSVRYLGNWLTTRANRLLCAYWYPGERWDQQYAHAVADTAYASCGDLSLAYHVFGDGPIQLVFAGPFISHIELFWTMPEFKAFFDQLARFCRVVVFDKAGVGLSDPVPHVRTIEDRAAEIEAVMDAACFGRAVLFGMNDGGFASIVFAATRLERTRALILADSYSFFGVTEGWDDSIATRPSCGRGSYPSWVKTTRRRWSRSPAFRKSAAPSARGGATVRH